MGISNLLHANSGWNGTVLQWYMIFLQIFKLIISTSENILNNINVIVYIQVNTVNRKTVHFWGLFLESPETFRAYFG